MPRQGLTRGYSAVTKKLTTVPAERIEKKILVVRDEKVILDADIAALYGVETRVLTQAVRRNIDRFPPDFMFQLSKEEFQDLKSQSVISSSGGWGGRRYPPYAFTEQGVAMLSGVLRSEQAVRVNIEIMRAFVRLRVVLSSHKELKRKLFALEKKYDAQFRVVFEAIRELMAPPDSKTKRLIGFRKDDEPET
ncbi:MAG: ORF6N domain-containing protein [Proteobacteria bacterium]|nr:ORF6N domain-containing protein [Pseudomonadota bacterium]